METENWKTAADNFISNESEFHLGFLITESSHRATRTLSSTIRKDTIEGILQLLSVDRDIADTFPGTAGSSESEQLKEAVLYTIRNKKRIIFSGCGSTGRLSVLLESLWRKGCTKMAKELIETANDTNIGDLLLNSAKEVRGIITGGDRALIKSVENFEDFQEFGRQQTRELNLSKGDLFIAVSEGGETSSVIGSAMEALETGCTTFFIFNNPKEMLIEKIKRSRDLIENPGVTAIDLTTGPMAVSGSTRMQATTMELLFIGSILERSILDLLKNTSREYLYERYPLKTHADYSRAFSNLLSGLEKKENRLSVAKIIELQENIYRNKKSVLYAADELLLDIFTDTTEQTPTFSLPPFKSTLYKSESSPWAVALHPRKTTEETWIDMLGREPEGLTWGKELYKKLGSEELSETPPKLDREEIYSYRIGADGFKLYKPDIAALITIQHFNSNSNNPITSFRIEKESAYRLLIQPEDSSKPEDSSNLFLLSLPLPQSPLQLFLHLAAKLIFNIISTGTMARMGRIKGNWMIEVTPSNKKLIDRSIRIISDLKTISYREAAYLVFKEIEKNPDDLSSLVARLL